MGHPIALISQQIRHGLKLANLWPKIGQQRSSIGFILYLEMGEQRFVSGALLFICISLMLSADCLGDSNFKQVDFANTNLESRTFRVTGTLTHGRSERAAARRWGKPERSTQCMNLSGEAGAR